jgi:hypothetical protein
MDRANMIERFQDELTRFVDVAQATQPGEFPPILEARAKRLDDLFEEALDTTFPNPEEPE